MAGGTVLVVGAGPNSIGESCAHLLGARGYDVIANAAPVDQGKVHSKYTRYYIDLMERTGPRLLADRAAKVMQLSGRPLRAVVYATGFNRMAAFDKQDADLWEQTVRLNARALVELVQELRICLPPDLLDPPVHVVGIGSNTAFVARRNSLAYAFSKAGFVHMLKCMDRELASDGWRFTSVDSGVVMDTGMTEGTINQMTSSGKADNIEDALELLTANVPGRTLLTRWQVARVVEQVLSVGPTAYGGCSVRIDSGQQQG